MINSLKTLYFEKHKICYTGKELAPHWIYRTFDLLGNSLVAFQGEADVSINDMIDLEDIKKEAPIKSKLMLHFIGEFFIDSLNEAILLQHLFVFEVFEFLVKSIPNGLSRKGNDLYFKGRKLSVSIATKSLTSVLIHFGINIHTDGTPVPTAGLLELGVDPKTFADQILAKFVEDLQIVTKARTKVTSR